MSKIFNQQAYVENGQFSGVRNITPVTGSTFFTDTQVYGGLYVGTYGDITIKTIDGSVATLKNIQGFVPGLITAVSASSTASDIVGFV